MRLTDQSQLSSLTRSLTGQCSLTLSRNHPGQGTITAANDTTTAEKLILSLGYFYDELEVDKILEHPGGVSVTDRVPQKKLIMTLLDLLACLNILSLALFQSSSALSQVSCH